MLLGFSGVSCASNCLHKTHQTCSKSRLKAARASYDGFDPGCEGSGVRLGSAVSSGGCGSGGSGVSGKSEMKAQKPQWATSEHCYNEYLLQSGQNVGEIPFAWKNIL